MNFNVKLDDKKLKVDVEGTNLKDVLIYCKPKERLVLMKKFGLGGEKGIPLQRIGQQYNLTRERIRQIETQALMRFRRLIVGNETYMNVLSEAKKILDAHGGLLAEDVLVSKLINRNLFKFSKSELRLILISDFDVTYLKRNKYLYKAFYIEPLYEDLLTKMTLFVNDYFEKRNGSQDIYEFIAVLKDTFLKEYKEVTYLRNDLFYINFFAIVRGLSMFDGKVGFDTFTDVNPKTMKLKVYYTMKRLNKPIHYQELPAHIIGWFPEKSVKINTIHNELVKNNDIFVNLGLGRYGLKEWGYEGGLVKDILVRIFEKNDRPMTVKELCKEVLKEKMVSPNTVMLNLQKYKDMFERIDKGVYQLKK
ncbi:MAG: sigma factor-like helix-turn-helix DNA-binding protein [Candidatus Absconditabacteria bacterium]|nr:sigma factor-like helix-turn-helix DNA-binding protein [Candidatus Absconditabacteria bacterium]MDD3868448.1 sigma factor-like helix-turn-helix DNA-binding protein [Candidatus Absconditabacteria bacterium]MDD4713978.1 sigma factor-like helix-turn-helix DNA-binding protein [Candidatus Absconditabacteria bacterium]